MGIYDNANDGFLNLLWEVVPDVENLIFVLKIVDSLEISVNWTMMSQFKLVEWLQRMRLCHLTIHLSELMN